MEAQKVSRCGDRPLAIGEALKSCILFELLFEKIKKGTQSLRYIV